MIDLRSDTVTKPTPAMRHAMANAEVGDDVYGEDPTVNALQQRAAQVLGKEAALFVPSGTMGNQIAIACHTVPGNEVICESHSHIIDYEMSAMAIVSGVIPRTVPGRDGGRLTWEDVRTAVRSHTDYNARTGLVALENSHNMGGGTVLSLEASREIALGAREMGLPVHLDGARVFNAALALGVPVSEVVEPFDSVMFCLSKGLAAPVGSLVVGTREFIERALDVRRVLGGAMRQVGILAAAGLVALEEMTGRLAEDHANAREIARLVSQLPGVLLDPESVQTNIVIFDLDERAPSGAELTALMEAKGVLASAYGPRRVRLVTHKDVSRDECLEAASIVNDVLST